MGGAGGINSPPQKRAASERVQARCLRTSAKPEGLRAKCVALNDSSTRQNLASTALRHKSRLLGEILIASFFAPLFAFFDSQRKPFYKFTSVFEVFVKTFAIFSVYHRINSIVSAVDYFVAN